MLLIPQAKSHQKRIKFKPTTVVSPPPPPPPPVALTLVTAEYDPAGPWLRVTFDQAIDIAAANSGTFQVVVGTGSGSGPVMIGTGTVVLVSPSTAQIDLVETGSAPFDIVVMSAGADSGVVSVAGALSWAGVTNLGLPFP
jgi:hypothetical protein